MADESRSGAPPSPVGALLRLGLAGLRRRTEPPRPRGVPRRRVAVERTGMPVDSRRVARFLRVTHGEGIRWDAGGAPLLPPTYPALWQTALMLELFLELGRGLPKGGLVHLESETTQLRPLRADEAVRCRTELDREEAHPRGTLLRIVSRNWNAKGLLCSEDAMVMLARGWGAEGRGGARSRSREDRERERQEAEWEEVASWALAGNHGRRYALVSGDFNPIHLWPVTSRPFGFRRPILHGFCTEGMVAHALIRERLGGDPAGLRRMRIAFRAPVVLPGHVRLLVGGRDFRVVAKTDTEVLAEGSFVGGTAEEPQG